MSDAERFNQFSDKNIDDNAEKNFSGMLKYQKWPNFDNFSHLSSKLDPNSKPFSPRKMPFAAIVAGKSKFSAASKYLKIFKNCSVTLN